MRVTAKLWLTGFKGSKFINIFSMSILFFTYS